jgi:hypothetical protein
MNHFVCISHLPWEAFQQRQRFPWRLIRTSRVIFVEPPAAQPDIEKSQLSTIPPIMVEGTTVTPVRLHIPARSETTLAYNSHGITTTYADLLTDFLAANGIEKSIVWLDTRQALMIAEQIPHRLIVMDPTECQGRAEAVSVTMMGQSVVVLSPSNQATDPQKAIRQMR